MSKLQPSGLGSSPSFLLKLLLPALIGVVMTLAGCGGGGGSSSGNPSPSGNGSSTPVASSGTVSATEDVAFSNTLSATDADGDALTYTIVTNGSKGTAVISNAASGAYTYTPNANANGTDSFTFKANDGTKDSNTATITITLAPVADTPVASASSVLTNQDTPATATLIASDADGDPLTYSIITNGTSGTAALTNAATGAFTYTPNANFYGSDSFTFRVNDGARNSNTATVTVTVNGAPVAADGCAYTPQPATDGAMPDFAGTLVATDPDSTQFTYQLADGSAGPFITANGGTVTITDPTTGAFTYKAKSLAAKGDRGLDTFAFKAVDTDGAVGNAVQSVIIDQTIMPLGDSITQGTINGSVPGADQRVAYRKPLYDSLKANGYDFDFVGTLTDGFGVANFDSDNQGQGGYTASEIASGRNAGEGVFNWLEANPSDIVLLHAGTNGLDPVNGPNEVANILDEIDRWENTANGNPVTVVLALIIDKSPHDQNITDFNNNVNAMATARINNGDKIIIVDQEKNAGLDYVIDSDPLCSATTCTGDMGSTLHPNAKGYGKMAALWFNPVTSLLSKCP